MMDQKLSAAASALCCSEDLLREILIRLPARDLIRLKSVSTQWKRIISDPIFAARHTQTTHLRPPAGAILYQQSQPWETIPVPLFGNPQSSVPTLSFMTKTLENFGTGFIEFQSCNGLLLCVFSNQEKPVLNLQSHCFVCNPTTRDFKLLPLPIHLKADEYLDGLTLAFNPSEPLRYKVIGIKKSYQSLGLPHKYKTHHLYTYTSETDCWKIVSFAQGLEVSIDSRHTGIFLKDKVFWAESDQMCYYNVYREEGGSIYSGCSEYGWANSFLVTSCGSLYYTTYGFSSSLECHEFDIFEFDTTTMKWLNSQHHQYDPEFYVDTHHPSPMLVAKGENHEDFIFLFPSKNGLNIFDLASNGDPCENKKLESDYHCACIYIPSLVPV